MKKKQIILFLVILFLSFSVISGFGKDIMVTIPDTSASSGSSISIPVNVTDVSGLEIYSYNFVITYNKEVLDASGVSVGNTISELWGNSSISDKDGQMLVAVAGTAALNGSGVLLKIDFNIVGETGAKSDLVISEFVFNEGVPAAVTMGATFMVQDLNIKIFDTSAKAGSNISIPIMISDVTGLDIFSYNFTLTYDQNALDATGISSAGTISESWASPTVVDNDGQIVVAALGTTTLAGSGVLLYIDFTVADDPGDQATLSFSELAFNEGTPQAQAGDAIVYFDPEVTHGPIAGGVSANSARFSLRTSSDADVSVMLSEDGETWANSLVSNTVQTVNEKDYFATVDIAELSPNTIYYYRPLVNGEPESDFSARFKTFPEENEAADFQFLFGSGQQALDDENSNIGNIFPLMAEENALFFLHQGDWFYPDTTDSEQGDSLNFFAKDKSLIYESYKTRYDSEFPMTEMLRVMPVDYTYDDHDWVNNNCDKTYMEHGGSNTIEIYQEAFPNYPLPSASNGVWHKFSCGNVDVFMVDNRAQRDPNMESMLWYGDRYIFMANYLDDHSIVGEEQLTWLLNELSASTAKWKFISSGTPFNPAGRGLIELTLMLQGTDYDPILDPATGKPFTMAFLAEEFADKWAGFPSDVYKLLTRIIDENIDNVIFLSGDTHTSGIDDGENSLIPEMMAGGLDRTNSQIAAFAKEAFKFNIWNKGGHTYDNAWPPDLGNAYGRVSVFGADSVMLDVVSETGNVLATHTVSDGYVPRKIAGVVAPGAIDFGTVQIGDQGGSAVIAISTSIDTFSISDISVTTFRGTGQIIPLEKTASLASGETKIFMFGFVPMGNVGDTTQALISFVCNDAAGQYPYVKNIVAQGVNGVPVGIDSEDQITKPLAYQLYQNYPNPFNSTTAIKFSVPEYSDVEITVFNSLGQKVRCLTNQAYNAGNYKVQWNGTNSSGQSVVSGVYFMSFKTADYHQMKKVLFLK